MITKKGIDISKHQSGIKLDKIAPQVDFIVIRATHGTTSVDEMFESYYEQCKALGVPVGCYHYFYYGDKEMHDAEMENFLKNIKGKEFDLPVFVDYEEAQAKFNPPLGGIGKEKITEYLLEDYQKIKDAGFVPGVYANKNWLTNLIDSSKIPGDMVVWLAQYAEKPTYTGRFEMWQYTSDGTLKDYGGRLDMNYLYEEDAKAEDIKVYSLAKDGDKKLSANFAVKEFKCRDGSDVVKMSDKTVAFAQKIRDHFGKPVKVNSAYRTPAYNKKIGGVKDSQHTYGRAIDLAITGVPTPDIYLFADSIGVNGLGLYDTFVHIDSREGRARWNESRFPTPFQTYKVKVTATALKMRSEPNQTSKTNGMMLINSTVVIVDEKNGWGKLENGKGWIALQYTKRV